MMRDAVRRGLLVVSLAGAGCALGLAQAPPPGPPQTYEQSDAHMAKWRFTVMPDPKNPTRPATFDRIPRVYVAGSGKKAPKVILLHELPGLRDGDIDLGFRLAEKFEVYMPLMFGVAGQDDSGLGRKQACKSGLFNCNDRNTRHAILPDLLGMTNEICRTAECGVIGMCLTGTFPLYLTPASNVVALVIAQPTLPFFHVWPFSGLDISEADTAAAMSAAAERKASIYMLRHRHDWISGHASFNRLVKRIERVKDALSFFDHREIAGHGHSTLVVDSHHPDVAKEQFELVVKALEARLRPPRP